MPLLLPLMLSRIVFACCGNPVVKSTDWDAMTFAASDVSVADVPLGLSGVDLDVE